MPMDRVMTPAGEDDLASTDEVKVYKDEGEEDENKASENLSEDKIGLVTETEERKESEEELPLFWRTNESECGTGFLGTAVNYRIGGRLPFGYPLITPYLYSYGSPLGLGGISITTGGPPLCMCNNDAFSSRAPPPAHLGLSPVPWHLRSHAGLPSRSPFLYGLVATSSPPPSSSILGLPSPYHQFPHPFYASDLVNPIGWSNPGIPMTSAYHLSRIGHHPSSSSPLDAPPSPSGLYFQPRAMTSQTGGKPSQPQLTAAANAFLGQHRHLFTHHSMDSFSTGATTTATSSMSSSRSSSRRTVSSASSAAKPFFLSSSPSSASGVGKLLHIKKPLNAFMIFMKEMRQRVIDECTLKESAAINQILGRKWHSLDRTEQAKYYELARREKERHRQLYPTWSARDNYALHSRRKRKRLQDDERTTTDTDDDRECPNAKKCRARYGLDKQNQWCKPCRRKKRCIRFLRESETSTGAMEEGEGEEERREAEREATTTKEEMQWAETSPPHLTSPESWTSVV